MGCGGCEWWWMWKRRWSQHEYSVAQSPHGVTEFLTPSHFVCLVAHSTGTLKWSKYLYTFSILTKALKYFNFDRCKFWSLAKTTVHSSLLKRALDSFIAYSTGILKSPNISNTLFILTYTFIYFCYKQIRSVSLVLRPGHFRVAENSFYINNPRQFWNSVNGDYKTHSHGK